MVFYFSQVHRLIFYQPSRKQNHKLIQSLLTSVFVYLAKKNPLVDDRGGEASVPSELREYTAARPNLKKFLMGSNGEIFDM